MNDETTTPEQQKLPTVEAETPEAPAPKVETKPAATDETAAELARLKAERDELAKFKAKTEEAALSAQEKLAKREKEAEEKLALLERQAEYVEAGLPKEWAAGVTAREIAKYLEKQIKAASIPKSAGQVISPAGSGSSGKTEQPGQKATELQERYRTSKRWQRAS